jgi:hypothetical protein
LTPLENLYFAVDEVLKALFTRLPHNGGHNVAHARPNICNGAICRFEELWMVKDVHVACRAACWQDGVAEIVAAKEFVVQVRCTRVAAFRVAKVVDDDTGLIDAIG